MSPTKPDEARDGVPLTNLDQALFDGAGATKRDLVDYLDAVSERILPGLAGRPLSVIRVHRGQEAFMQKNVPKYTPDWVQTVTMWAETSKREVSYALCNDRRTLLWFANQRAVEYHPALVLADQPERSTASAWAGRSRRAARRACTSSCPSTAARRWRTRQPRPARSPLEPPRSIPSWQPWSSSRTLAAARCSSTPRA
jgi:hypothetical protein